MTDRLQGRTYVNQGGGGRLNVKVIEENGKPMSCLSVQEIFFWLEGKGNQSVSAAVERHFGSCPSCSRKVEALALIERLLSREMGSSSFASEKECPDPQDLIAFVEGNDGSLTFQHQAIVRHLEACESCAYWTAQLRYLLGNPMRESAKAPRALLKKARDLMAANKRGWTWGRYALALGTTAAVCFAIVIGVRYHQQPVTVAELHPPAISTPAQPKSDDGLSIRNQAGAASGKMRPTTKSAPASPTPSSTMIKRNPTDVLTAEVLPPTTAEPTSERSGDTMLMRGPTGTASSQLINVTFRYRPIVSRVGSKQTLEQTIPFKDLPAISTNDEYALRVRLAKDGWLYVFQMNSEGHLVQLFPNPSNRTGENPLHAGQENLFPNDQAWYHLDETIGTETIYIAFSVAKAEDWELLFGRCREGNPQACQDLVGNLQHLASSGIADSQLSRIAVTFRFQHISGAGH